MHDYSIEFSEEMSIKSRHWKPKEIFRTIELIFYFAEFCTTTVLAGTFYGYFLEDVLLFNVIFIQNE